tara:strand:- start:972 stop:1199 length:228 start_codon:yes stop_codon:yes gene_type:complete
MRLILCIFLLIFLNNCSLNKDSQYWTEETFEKKDRQKKLSEILKKSKDIRSMTLEDYKIYIEDYTKKSNYPDISK